jgi:hypothetical protein
MEIHKNFILMLLVQKVVYKQVTLFTVLDTGEGVETRLN